MERGRAGLTLTRGPGKPEPGRHCMGTSGGLLSAYGVPIGSPCRPALVREEESLGWKSGRIAAPTSSHLLRSGTCRLSQQGRGRVSRQGPWGAGVPACFPGCVSGTFWSLSAAWQGPTLAFARVSWGDGSLRRAQEGHEAGPPRLRSSSSRWAPHASRPSWQGAGKRVPERRRRPGRSDAGHWASRAGWGVGRAGPGSHHCPLGVWRAPRRPSYRLKQTGGPFRSLAFVLPSVRPQKVERRTPTCA
uniref:Uncharacterized protein n=1 Tax=Rousettus aegyptiacus TaxID=9407 RepID=A0A7J8B9P3_ROUAE|nr:hypothetical protein HJG63_009935 [Rousettus aegyptiacus]